MIIILLSTPYTQENFVLWDTTRLYWCYNFIYLIVLDQNNLRVYTCDLWYLFKVWSSIFSLRLDNDKATELFQNKFINMLESRIHNVSDKILFT